MEDQETVRRLEAELLAKYPEKFVEPARAFGNIRRGARIFMGTGCGQPRMLLSSLLEYSENNPKTIFDTELYTLLIFGMEEHHYGEFESIFRHHCFSIRDSNRQSVNRGTGDYNPAFLSSIPRLVRKRLLPIDVALIQVTPPDEKGMTSLGISVDITGLAVKTAPLVIAQVNPRMPRTGGDSLVHMDDINYAVFHDEPLFEYRGKPAGPEAEAIGQYVAGLIEDGSTIQVGLGDLAQSVIPHLKEKKHLGIHTELLSDAIVELIRCGAVDNSCKTLDSGKTVATFCMGKKDTYDFIDGNPHIEMRKLEYTNNPVVIALHEKMVAIHGVLSVDLTGQATAESIGTTFYGGLGGTADFVRGALLSQEGKSILVLPSTARHGAVSRIVPFLSAGEGVTVNRGDVHYVVTEHGVANLMGKNVRQRAIELVRIAHPDFRPWLMEEARRHNLVLQDQAFIPGERGEYPLDMERRASLEGLPGLLLRPVKITDEPIIKEFFYSLSDRSMYYRYFSLQREMPREHIQRIAVIDYEKEMTLLAVASEGEREVAVGIARYIMEDPHFANFNIAVRDPYQHQGVGKALLSRLIEIAHGRGISGFTLEVLLENRAMRALMNHFRKLGHVVEMQIEGDTGLYLLSFNGEIIGG